MRRTGGHGWATPGLREAGTAQRNARQGEARSAEY
jgi:hypothetical protein